MNAEIFPKISVIVPVYNSEEHLEECLNSILAQTFASFELILIDDDSRDSSLEICIKYAKKDGRIQVYRKKHEGPGPARNLGLHLATGKYLLFLDSDDFFERKMFELLYSQAEQEQCDIVFYGYSKFNNITKKNISIIANKYLDNIPQTFNPKDYYDILFQFSGSEAWKYFFRSDFVKHYALKFAKTMCGEDIVFTMPARALAKRISFLDKALVHYRIGVKNQLTHRRNFASQLKKSYAQAWRILKKHKLQKLLKKSFIERKRIAKIWVKKNKNYF